MKQLLHTVHYKAMVGHATVVDKMEPHYGVSAALSALDRIKDYYKDDLLEYTLYGPEEVVEVYHKYPYMANKGNYQNED